MNNVGVNKKKDFLKQFFKEKKTVGAVSPSSRFLLNKMLKSIDFDTAQVIVEFGPGTGVFTKEIIKRMQPNCKLLVIELNDSFYDKIQQEFTGMDQVILCKDSAENLESLFEQHGLLQADVIVSSLPLAIFPGEVVDNILLASKQHLKEDGLFIQFQYSLSSKRKLEKYFENIKITFTARNLPPAFVYNCSNS